MKTFYCIVAVMLILLASMMLWMAELVSRGMVASSVTPTRYFVSAVLFGAVAAAALRGAVKDW